MAARERSNSFLSKPDASVGLMETLSSSLPARKSQSARDEEDKLKKMAKACATLLECPSLRTPSPARAPAPVAPVVDVMCG